MVTINKATKPIAATDNSQQTFKRIEDIDHIRVTQIEGFIRCPLRFKSEVLGHGKTRTSRALINGTLCHQWVEAFLRGAYELEEADVYNRALQEGLEPELAKLLWRYLDTLKGMRSDIYTVEHEFNLQVLESAPVLRGHIDAAFRLPDDGLLILDHKTNKSYESENVWSQRVQQTCYAVAASIIWPQFKYIEFEIGYIVLDKKVRWRVDLKQARQEMLRLFGEMWSALKVYNRTGEYPARINEYCGNCCIHHSCAIVNAAHDNFMESLVQIDEKPLVERYLYAKHVLASIETKTNELKAEVIEQLQNNDGKLEHNGMLLYLYNGKRREIEYSAFAEAIANTMKQSPEIANALHDRYYELLDSTLTVKMGMVDALVTNFPTLKSAVDAAVTTSESESPTLRVTVKDKK